MYHKLISIDSFKVTVSTNVNCRPTENESSGSVAVTVVFFGYTL